MKSRIYIILTLVSLLFMNRISQAQDLIVTLEGDSINCKISQIVDNRIFFSYLESGKSVKSMLSMQDVTYYETNFYASQIKQESHFTRYGHSALDLMLTGGYTYRTASIDPDMDQFMKDYIKGIKSGFVLGADLVFYFTDEYGGGIKYNTAFYSNRVDNVIITYTNGTVRNGTVSDNISITFIGPAFHSRKFTGLSENCFTLGMALGIMSYKNNSIVIDPMTITSQTVGIGIDAGYEFQLGSATSLGIRLSYITGTLTELKIEDNTGSSTLKLKPGEYESLTRIDAQAVLKIRIF